MSYDLNGNSPSPLLRIWDLRLSERSLEAWEEFVEFLSVFGVQGFASTATVVETLTSNGWMPPAILDVLSLQIAFLRFEMQMEEAEKKAIEARKFATTACVTQHFQLFFQSGLNASTA